MPIASSRRFDVMALIYPCARQVLRFIGCSTAKIVSFGNFILFESSNSSGRAVSTCFISLSFSSSKRNGFTFALNFNVSSRKVL